MEVDEEEEEEEGEEQEDYPVIRNREHVASFVDGSFPVGKYGMPSSGKSD